MKDRSTAARLGRVEYIRFELTPEEEPQFFADYQFAKGRLEDCEDCVGYELCRAKGRGQFLLRIEWDASSAAWPTGQRPRALERFLFALKSGLKSVTSVGAYEQVRGGVTSIIASQETFRFDSKHA